MPGQPRIEECPNDNFVAHRRWPSLPSVGGTALVVVAIRSDQAEGAFEKIRVVLPQASLLYAGGVGEWSPILAVPDRHGELTARQVEILKLLRLNMSNKEIGRKLDLSHFTVRNHVSQLMKRFNVRSRREVALLGATEQRAENR